MGGVELDLNDRIFNGDELLPRPRDNSSVPWVFVRNVCTRMEDVSGRLAAGDLHRQVPASRVGTFGNYGPVIQVGSGESGSGGDAGG